MVWLILGRLRSSQQAKTREGGEGGRTWRSRKSSSSSFTSQFTGAWLRLRAAGVVAGLLAGAAGVTAGLLAGADPEAPASRSTASVSRCPDKPACEANAPRPRACIPSHSNACAGQRLHIHTTQRCTSPCCMKVLGCMQEQSEGVAFKCTR